MNKVSIRFYNDHEVRAIWDEENAKWWFSVLDVIGALNIHYLTLSVCQRVRSMR